MRAGIEAINVYAGSASLDVNDLAKARNLDNHRFENLMMKEKSVPMPYEDPVSNGINAAMPIIEKLSAAEKDSIDMVITCTESGIDFGKSISTYIHHYLGLNRNCRLFELKNACYSGTAGFQMAVNFVYSQTAPGRKVLVICTDIARMSMAEGMAMDISFFEPSNGSGAVAILVSDNPVVFEVDRGANGYYGYEVMDTCRPIPDQEAGNADLSLLSYLDCSENTFKEYQKRVEGADYQDSFQYLAFHTPFGGMVKGAHRTNMRKFKKARPDQIESDFEKRVTPSLRYCQRVGNIMGATSQLALLSTIANGDFSSPKRIGVFSYGSGCSSEFYSGVATKASQDVVNTFHVARELDSRYKLSMKEYEDTFTVNHELRFGIKNYQVDFTRFPQVFNTIKGRNRIVLKEIKDFHRIYEWV